MFDKGYAFAYIAVPEAEDVAFTPSLAEADGSDVPSDGGFICYCGVTSPRAGWS
jgi:hypothetical protein